MSDAPYRELFNAIDQGVCVLEVIFEPDGTCRDYRHVEVNAAFENQTGLINGIGKRMRELFPDMEDHWPSIYGDVARTGEPIRSESYFSGLGRWFEVHAVRVGEPHSGRVGVVFTDRTSAKRAELRGKFLEDLSRTLNSAAGETALIGATTEALGKLLNVDRCYFVECSPSDNLIVASPNWVNAGTLSIEGRFSLEANGGTDWWRRYTSGNVAIEDADESGVSSTLKSEYVPDARAFAVQPFRREGPWTTALVVTSKSPRTWSALDLELMKDTIARVWPMVERTRAERKLEATVQELQAASKKSEAASKELAEAANRFNLLSDVVALQVWTANEAGNWDYLNRSGLNFIEPVTLTGERGLNWLANVHPDDAWATSVLWNQSLRNGQRFETKFRLKDKHDQYRWFLSRAEMMRGAQGQIKWIGSNTDIDDLKQAEATAERASKAKDEFLAALSHELRTPLTPVLMTVSELRLDESLPAEVRSQLTTIERNVALEARLIDDLLDLTKIVNGKLQLFREHGDAHSLIGQALEIVREEARAKNITLQRRFEATHSEVNVDPARFQQVIWNLLRNSVKFTERGGNVEIATSVDQKSSDDLWLRITVTDNGIGIDPTLLDAIFKPFEQGPLRGAHRFGGLGLGLAIARAVVDLHGGHITAKSLGAGRGATFIVELPGAAKPRSGISERETEVAIELQPASPLRILLVEDHETTLRTVLILLGKEGHSVVPATNVIEALEAARTQNFDLVISDLGLPDGTGIELMEQLRRDHGLQGIALSGYGMEEDLARSREAGFVSHLVKPVNFDTLRTAIRRTIKTHP